MASTNTCEALVIGDVFRTEARVTLRRLTQLVSYNDSDDYYNLFNEVNETEGPPPLFPEQRSFGQYAYMCNIINHFLIISLTVTICWKCHQLNLAKTALHAYLCTLGYLFLIAEGVMVRYGGNVFTYKLSSDTKTIVHFLCQMLGVTLGLFGAWHKINTKRKHFTTPHGQFGIAACILCFVNVITGCLNVKSALYIEYVPKLLRLLFHDVTGIFLFVSAMISQINSYDTGFFRRNFSNIAVYKICTLFILFLTGFVALDVFTKKFLTFFK